MPAPCRAVLLIAVVSILGFGQAQVSSGDIHGTITDQSGGAIRGARVTAVDPDRGITRTAQSDDFGEYRIPLLPPGVYRVRAEAPGFSTTVVERTEVRVGDTVVLSMQMMVGQVTTEVNVSGEMSTVEPERTQQSSTLQSQQILNLPINRRNYLDFALLTPGVAETNDLVDGTDFRVVQAPQSGLSFGGSNGRGNAFMVDGVENYVNSGGVRPSIGQEAVGEFQVNRNSYSAEFGGGFGGAVNIVSRSGSNDFHGNLFGFLRNRAIQARNYFDPNPDGSAYTRYQVGATLGGPIVEDRTLFFLAFERLDRKETSFVPILQDRSAFSRLTASQDQLLGFMNNVAQLRPLAAGLRQSLTTTNYPRTLELFNRNSGNFPFSEDTNLFSFRLDHRFTPNNMLFMRGNMARSDSAAAQLGALLAYNRGRNIGQYDHTVMLNDTWVMTDRLVSETRAMFGHYKIDVTTIDPFGPQIDISGYGLFGREIFLPSNIIERHYQLMQTMTYSSGRHALKFGGDFNPVRDNVHSETFFSGRFSFGEVVPLAQLLITATGDSNFPATLIAQLNAAGQGQLAANVMAPITALQAYNLGLPTFYQQGFGNPDWPSWSKRYNFFVNDTWRVHPRITLNLGARYELEANHRVVGTDPNNVAPRIGLAWTLTEDARTVLRAGYGMFYSQNTLQISNVADTLSGSYIQQVFVPLTGIPGLNN
ncbi:MAG TPA: TonB-dependent receptor, partial [Bryobacteraceae bacterium]|nr:TonB-dependent receptor [Bryobacteraceae bacterium]